MAGTPEEIIDSYLRYLEDPSSIVDEAKVAEAQQAVDAAESPTAKVIAISRVHRVRNADPAELIADFVSVAKSWGEANEVDPDAWKAMGVPTTVLIQAGIVDSSARGTSAASAPRAKRVSAQEVEAAIPEGQFTVKTVTTASGATAATVKTVIDRLIDEGRVKYLGKDASFTGQGARPNLYEKLA